MIPFDPFTVLIAAAAGAILYAVVIRYVPGMQPGEAKLDALLEKIGIHTTAVQQLVAAITPAAVTASPAAVPAAPALAPVAFAVPQPVAASPAPAAAADAWPHLIRVGDTNIMASAPISSGWQPSFAMWALGHQDGTFVADPSLPLGARSPAGYPVSNGRVLYGETSFDSDAAVMAYLAAQAQSAVNATPAPGSFVPGTHA